MSVSAMDRRTLKKAVPAMVIFFFFCAMVIPGNSRGAITEGFDNFDTGTRPADWIFNGCNNDWDTYTSAGNYYPDIPSGSPSIKLVANTYYIQTETFFHQSDLRFWVKGMGTNANSTLLVEEYYSGASWSTVTSILDLPTADGIYFDPIELNFQATIAKFTFQTGVGAIAFDFVNTTDAAPTPTPTAYITTPTPTAYVPTATPTLAPSPSPTGTPYTDFPNPSFELGTGTDPADLIPGWTRMAVKPYVARSTDQAYDGIYSCTFSATGYVTDSYSDQGIRSGEVSIIGGDDYDVGGWFRVANEGGSITDTQFKFNIEWLSGGIVVSTDSDSDWFLAGFEDWENREYRETAPASADQVRIYIAAMETANNNNNVYIDMFSLTHAPAIIVTSPTLNEAWYINTINNITWDSYQVTGNVDIHYNTDGGPWTPVDTNIADTGTYPWNVFPDPSDQARVRVQETGGGGVSGQSDLFRIVRRDTINVDAPRGGEIWYRTGVYNIEWTYGPDVGLGNVDLHYSTNNGSLWTLIASGVAIGSSPYPWTIPYENSSNCLVRVRQPSSGRSGQSPAVFTIASPFFTVTSPAGEEYWYYPDKEEITWTFTSGISGNVNIDYSITGIAGPWYQIAANQPNTGSYYPWPIPNITTTNARVRVSEVGGVGLPGISDADFTLTGYQPRQDYIPLEWEVWMEIDTECPIISIEAFDNNNIWLGCGCGLVYYWNGDDWKLQADQGGEPMLGTNVNEFIALDSDDVYGGGSGGLINHYNGSYWAPSNYGIGKTVYCMDGADPTHVAAGCSSGWIHYDPVDTPLGTTWNLTSTGESGSLYGCAYLRPDQVYLMRKSSATVSSTVFYTSDWTTFTNFGSFGGWGLGDHPLGGCIDQDGSTLLWAAGDCGVIYHYNGSNWNFQTQVYYVNFECIEVLDGNNVWVSGSIGDIKLLLHYNGSKWVVEADTLPKLYQLSAVDNRHVYGIGSTTSNKIYRSWAEPTPTPYRPTPIDWQSPTPTPVPVDGPISGRVYDRETGAGISNIYVRSLPLEPGVYPKGDKTNSSGNYSIPSLEAGTYNLYADSNQGSGIRVYRSQWYNQKDSQRKATTVSSNTWGKDFPLYKNGVYPTPTPTPTPDFQAIMVASGDYNGDGFSDIAIFRGASGLWAVRGITRLYFGVNGDLPISGDYDGDGTADVAVFRSSIGLWAARGVTRAYFGGSADQPIPGDYDGDGFCDIGIFRDYAGLWAVSGVTRVYFGGAADQPAIGDYDGDGLVDIALFRDSVGLWAIRGLSRIYYGANSDIAVPGDYNGTGYVVPVIYRPISGLWAVHGVTRVYFGGVGYQPVPADYDGKGRDEIGIFRPDWSLWAIREVTRDYFGITGDMPATR